MASTLVSSLKRLYASGKLTAADIAARVEHGAISAEEYATITGEEYEDGGEV